MPRAETAPRPKIRAASGPYDAARIESRVRELWELQDVAARARTARQGGEPWYFIDGPPYATGHIHLGTARNKTLKDAMLRHMRMRGFQVRDQPGFDMHGLPIEVKVEQELGFATKKDIESYGVDRFVDRCREFAVRFKDIMTDEFQELGVWMDWDRPYMTITNGYMEGAWWALAQAHERGLLYESERVLTWCWRCETALAAAEIEFEERRDPSVYVKFPLKDRPGEFLVIWTTTPWTLPANVAVAAHPSLDYALARAVRDDGREERLLVARDLVEAVGRAGRYRSIEVVQTLSGRDLEGLRYEHPFAEEIPWHAQPPAGSRRNTVLLSTHVAADRTGLVHTATGHGVEDFEVGARYDIPPFCPVSESGHYTAEAGPFAGLAVKSREETSPADARVLELLRGRGLLLASRPESHAYGHCWRCKNPIVYRATRQWFVDVGKIKDTMLAEVDRVRWTPEWAGSARQRDWVVNARDWCVSRQRYWGIPLPVWRCRNEHLRVVGTRRELEQDGVNYQPDMDLHRPWIDDVYLSCRQCGETMTRVPDVLDVWFDSAVASWAELDWPGEEEGFERWFPCDFIVEGLDQTRGWFYSQLCAGVAALNRVPYEAVLMHGWVNDEQGRPMSKSLGNIIPPHDVIVKHGADTLRFELIRAGAPWDDLSFGWESARNTARMFNILWNVHVFATTYMAMDGFSPPARPPRLTRPEDRWLRSRTASLTAAVHAAFGSYELHRAAREIERFVLEDLSRWYVRLVRDRVWEENDAPDKTAAYAVLHEALLRVSQLLAPLAPFLSEALYQDLGGAQASVHLEDWPAPDASAQDLDLEAQMATVRDVVEAAANARQKAGMKLRWPVARLVVAGGKEVERALSALTPLLLDQTNAKAVEYAGETWEGLEMVAQPVKNAIGPALKARAGEAIRALAVADARAVRAGLARGGYEAAPGLVLTPDMVAFETRVPADVTGASFGAGSVYLDATVTDDLKGEGYARDLTRRIQELRKRLSLPVQARIVSEVAAPREWAALVAPHRETVAAATRSAEVRFVADPQGEIAERWDLEGDTVVTAIRRVAGEAAPAQADPPIAKRKTAAKARKTKPPARKAKAAPPARKAKPAAPARKAKARRPAPAAAKPAKARKAPGRSAARGKAAKRPARPARPAKAPPKKRGARSPARKGKGRTGKGRRS